MVVLKRLDDARRDGDRVYAVIRSVGTSSDGKGQRGVRAERRGAGEGAAAGVRDWRGSRPATIELVEAHGTGHEGRRCDRGRGARTRCIGEAQPVAAWCALGSVKSQIGHTKAAAGAAGLIKAALALHHKVLPPTIKVRQPDRGSLAGADSPFYLNTEARPWLPPAGASAPRGRQRLRLRRQQLSLRPRGSRGREDGDRLGRRCADPGVLGG